MRFIITSKSDLYRVERAYKPRRDCSQKEWVEREWRKHRKRQQRKRREEANREPNVALIQLAGREHDGDLCDELKGRAKNIEAVKPTTVRSWRKDVDNGRYSSRCTYTHWTYIIYVESWAKVSPCGRLACYRVHDDSGVHHGGAWAPKGYRWKIDENGYLMLVRNRCGTEYHPDGWDIRQGKSHLRDLVLTSSRNRLQARRLEKEQRKQREQFERSIPTIHVTWHDARRAGNCAPGIRSFCDDHGIPVEVRNYSVPARVLQRMANGRKQNVDRAIQCAWQRETEVSI